MVKDSSLHIRISSLLKEDLKACAKERKCSLTEVALEALLIGSRKLFWDKRRKVKKSA